MSGNSKSTREAAENAFGKTQTQFLARGRVVSEQEAESAARDAKTARLKALRLERETAPEPAKVSREAKRQG